MSAIESSKDVQEGVVELGGNSVDFIRVWLRGSELAVGRAPLREMIEEGCRSGQEKI
jgi:hypothetical protein